MTILDVPRRTTQARLVAAAQSAGLHWAVRASPNEAGRLTTVVTRTGPDGIITFRRPAPALRRGQLISMWLDRNPGTPGIPAFLLLHTAPDVVHASAVLASGARRYMRLSPVVEDFGVRFGAAPLPGEDPLTGVEIHSRLRGVRLIELWRPPRRAVTAGAPA
jgi:hypothetical protein